MFVGKSIFYGWNHDGTMDHSICTFATPRQAVAAPLPINISMNTMADEVVDDGFQDRNDQCETAALKKQGLW